MDSSSGQEAESLKANQESNSSLNRRLLQRADLLLMQGYDQFHACQFEAALHSWNKSLGIYRELGIRQAEGAVLTNLGLACEGLGDYAKAIDYLDKAMAIAIEIQDYKGSGDVLINLGNVYIDLGRYEPAINYYEQGLEIAQNIPDIRMQAAALGNLGNACQIIGDYDKAIDYLEKSLKLTQKLKDIREQANVLGNLGWFYYVTGELNKAIKSYQKSLKIKQEIGDRRGEAHTIGRLGLVYGELGDYQREIEHHQQSLSIIREIKYRIGEVDSLKNLGDALLKCGDFEKATIYLYEAIQIGESLRSELGEDVAPKVSFFETQDLTYRLLQTALIDQNKLEEALEISERGRSRMFVEFLAGKLRERTDSKFTGTLPKIEHIKQIATEHNATLVEYSIIYDGFRTEGKLQAKESELFIWVIQPLGTVTFQRVNLKPLWQKHNTALADFVSTTRESIGVRGRDALPVNTPDSTNTDDQNLQHIHEILIQPIADCLPKNVNEKVIFIPHESLFLVPFPALQDANGKYLIEKHTILTAPSIQILDLTHRQRQQVRGKNNDILVVGNPTMPQVCLEIGKPPQRLRSLPGAEREAIEIAKLFKTKAIIGDAATKKNIAQQMTEARIIHLATHGLLDDFTGAEIPGAIALAPSGEDNGLLTAGEILQMQLNAELVVLSACNTGRGRLTGDGVTGLSRSLISAGVKSVIVSLWAVFDAATAELMVDFYQNLDRGFDKAQALRQAMLTSMIQHPNSLRSWAAFTLIGEAE
ncbi:CHAT domain-containing tetratricopeptide repeat protein [Microcoleus sp. Z1_C3]|jgi:CHAT domain-containing protein/Tfp pilus assembly protein PilF|uniref:CHAT domain-containing tetratricopeptide repeat protein n=1 Tax=unclassified Microcoleus TaxID=2642155 RepID=UPI002FD34D12